jgi:hypothetical protein
MARIGRAALGEMVFSACMLALGVYLFVSTYDFRGAEDGTRDFPQVYAVVIAGGGLVGLIGAAVRGRSRPQPAEAEPAALEAAVVSAQGSGIPPAAGSAVLPTADRPAITDDPGGAPASRDAPATRPVPRWMRPVDRIPLTGQVIIAVTAYVLVLDRIGYLTSTVAFGIALMWLLNRRVSWALFLFPAAMTVVLYAIFEYVLSVNLP